MLQFNLQHILQLRGVEQPIAFFVSHGMDRQAATRLLKHNNPFLSSQQIENLCTILNCTPNDIYRFTPNENTPPNHPLRALVHEEIDVLGKLRNMSLEELTAFNKLLQEKK